MSPPAATYMCVSSQFFGYTDDSPDFDFGLVCELRFWTTDSQRICTPDDAILVTVILESVCKGNPIFFRQSLLPIDTVRRISWHRIDKKSVTSSLPARPERSTLIMPETVALSPDPMDLNPHESWHFPHNSRLPKACSHTSNLPRFLQNLAEGIWRNISFLRGKPHNNDGGWRSDLC